MGLLTIKKSREGSQSRPIIIVVSKKVSKKATERNLLKRRLRKIVEPFIKETGKDIKVITRPGATKLSFRDLKNEFLKEIK